MKKLFKNYNIYIDKSEAKVLSNFCKQAVNQMSSDNRFIQDVKCFNSIINKLSAAPGEIKFTKDEIRRCSLQLNENLKNLETKIKKSWFLKKWLFKSVFNQYNSIYQKLNN